MLPIRPISQDSPYKMLFVCLGNICRSPTGEGIMQHLVNEANLQAYFEIDSAGTAAYHVGEPANSKSQATANKHGVYLPSKARRIAPFDLDYFDVIFAMDRSNLSDLQALAQSSNPEAPLYLLREFDPESPIDKDVPDPYYGGLQGFENVYQMVYRSCEAILSQLKESIER